MIENDTVNNKTSENSAEKVQQLFSFRKENYKYLYIGLAINVLGFILMIGGAATELDEFNADELFSHVRITLSPFLILLGYAVIMYSIMRKPKS